MSMSRPETNPFDLEWFEVRVLIVLNDKRTPVFLRDLTAELPEDIRGATICSLDKMAEENLELVRLIEPRSQMHSERLIQITPKGRAVLFEILESYKRREAVAT